MTELAQNTAALAPKVPCSHSSVRVDFMLDSCCLRCGADGYWFGGKRLDRVHPSGKLLFDISDFVLAKSPGSDEPLDEGAAEGVEYSPADAQACSGIKPGSEEPVTRYYTFGFAHAHAIGGFTYDKDIVVQITDPNPRLVMLQTFGQKWAGEYKTLEEVGMHHYPRGVKVLR